MSRQPITCPQCGYKTLEQTAADDTCTNINCNYSQHYRDAYPDEPPLFPGEGR